MEPFHVLAWQVSISLLVYGLLAHWFVAPYLRQKPVRTALVVLTLPHLIRHISAVSLTPGIVVGAGMPQAWAWTVTLGDQVSLLLALATIAALRGGWPAARWLAWGFAVVGALDIVHVVIEARRLAIVPHLGAQWFVPAMVVPVLIVSHALIFATLIRRGSELEHLPAGPASS